MVLKRILVRGEIWFGCPPGYPPFLSLRLPKELGHIVKLFGQKVVGTDPSSGASHKFTGIYLIESQHFSKMIQSEGFGTILWNEHNDKEAFVSMEVKDEMLVKDFMDVGKLLYTLQPT